MKQTIYFVLSKKRPGVSYRFVFPFLLLLFGVVLAACGGSAAPAGSQEVQVTLSDFKVASSTTTFSAGKPYHFVVTNTGKTAHELLILPMNMSMEHMSMDDMHKVALAMIDNVNPGETKTLDFTFPSSTTGQNVELSCHLPGHYEAGMKLAAMISK